MARAIRPVPNVRDQYGGKGGTPSVQVTTGTTSSTQIEALQQSRTVARLGSTSGRKWTGQPCSFYLYLQEKEE